jgi:hypothetical protein
MKELAEDKGFLWVLLREQLPLGAPQGTALILAEE